MTNDTTKKSNQAKSPKTIVAKLKQDFCQKLDTLAYGSSHNEVFRSWAEIAAIAMHQLPYLTGCIPKGNTFEAMEAHYLKLAAKQERETLHEFASLLALVQLALAHQWTDFLGAIYFEMEISGKKSKQSNGEFFTPYHLSKVAAQLTLLGCEEVIKQQGYLTISEPACGAGSMLIAACEVIAEKGYAPDKAVFFQAVDINQLCFHMSYIQFASLGLSGIVCHGDTLRNELWKQWETPQHKIWRFLTGRSPFHSIKHNK
ncbi:N-6 DNA methylase [Lusitaniella coriacea LEGE 07157]|uniref:site-specific DNA-methyltransferase (adenine-specific) n=1 Tax=Lusitaniella coriacea LEGE 07157 TaxID=945747 RepID=A0A8J7IVH4_9CYAN|nr:N-6 DNA methylase [Lusitaniella coriacea]MBE9117268.1 N-6 DNA methylase [Lusitaniella coriacea LEGE 07157]